MPEASDQMATALLSGHEIDILPSQTATDGWSIAGRAD